MTDIAKQITKRRVELDMSMRQLAGKVGVSTEAIRKIESGKTKSPRAVLLTQISQVLKLDLENLLLEPNKDIRVKAIGKNLEIVLPFEIQPNSLMMQRLTKRLTFEIEMIQEETGI